MRKINWRQGIISFNFRYATVIYISIVVRLDIRILFIILWFQCHIYIVLIAYELLLLKQCSLYCLGFSQRRNANALALQFCLISLFQFFCKFSLKHYLPTLTSGWNTYALEFEIKDRYTVHSYWQEFLKPHITVLVIILMTLFPKYSPGLHIMAVRSAII